MRHLRDPIPDRNGLNHAQSPNWRHWGILMDVHSVLLEGTDGLGTISFPQLDRGDNDLKLHS
jgi:hypothetical protein